MNTTLKTKVIEFNLGNCDEVNTPKHYISPKPLPKIYQDENGNYYAEAIDVAQAWGLDNNAWMFNVLKYILRAGRKTLQSVLKDTKKTGFYLNKEIARLEELGDEGVADTITTSGGFGDGGACGNNEDPGYIKNKGSGGKASPGYNHRCC